MVNGHKRVFASNYDADLQLQPRPQSSPYQVIRTSYNRERYIKGDAPLVVFALTPFTDMSVPPGTLVRFYATNRGGRKNTAVTIRRQGKRVEFLPGRVPPRKSNSGLTPVRLANTNAMNVCGCMEEHKFIDYLLVGEIEDAVFKGLTCLEETKLPDDAIGFIPVEAFNQIKDDDRNALYDDDKKRWIHWPPLYSNETTSGEREAMLAECFNEIGKAVAQSMGTQDAPRKWSSKYCNTDVPDDRCHLRPDNVLMNAADADSSNTSKSWATIFAVAELKSGNNAGKPVEQLAQSVRLIFGTQPDRTFVMGVVVDQDKMTFTVFNRSGIFLSDEFNVHERPERLIRIVAGMMFADRNHIGFDRTTKITTFDELEPFDPYIEVNGNRYFIVETLHVESVIRGRATVCYTVISDGMIYVVKTGWVDETRTKEPDILRKLEGILGVPTMKESQVLPGSSKDDFTATLETQGVWSIAHAELMDARVEARVQVRVVLNEVGTSILDFSSLKELLLAFIRIVEGTLIRQH